MIRVLLSILLFLPLVGTGQQNLLPLNSYYKDRLFHTNARMTGYSGNAFFPLTEHAYNLDYKIADTSKQYTEFSYRLFQKHLFEIKGENYYLTISPVFDFSLGKDLADTAQRKLFQNTRGFHVEGDLFKNFSFSTSFYENQSRNAQYQADYYRSIGERYINSADSTYYSAFAVMPGAARTKDFKVDGFDYAYAIGSIVYQPWKVLTLSAGNTSHFIGNGHRSLFLSDNSCPAPFYQANYRFQPRWEFVYYRSRLMNLLRRPASSTPETYYETKGYAVNYLSFQASEKWNIALFEGTIFSKGDSIHSTRVHPLYYNPVPFLNAFALPDSVANSVLGLDIGYTPVPALRLYAQVAYNSRTSGYGGQFGMRIMQPFHVTNLFIQAEFNHASRDLYTSANPRLNYSHYHLPLAHVKGGGFSELLLRCTYEWRRVYVDFKTVYYLLEDYNATSLLPIHQDLIYRSGTTLQAEVEAGYRFNRKMNFSVFVHGIIRYDGSGSAGRTNTQLFSAGLKTALRNIYTDF